MRLSRKKCFMKKKLSGFGRLRNRAKIFSINGMPVIKSDSTWKYYNKVQKCGK
jgi:hypothetical protein